MSIENYGICKQSIVTSVQLGVKSYPRHVSILAQAAARFPRVTNYSLAARVEPSLCTHIVINISQEFALNPNCLTGLNNQGRMCVF